MSTFLHTSQRGALRALAGQGIFAVECHAQLRALLLQRLGPEHAALLAEPQHDPERRSVDWYTDADGPAVPVSQLPPDEAEALRDKAGALARDIQSLANQLDAEGHNAALSGQLLALALRHPADDDLWSVNGQPVLTNWGFAPGAVGAQPQDLTRLGAFAPAPAPAAAPAAAVAAPVAAAPAAARGCLLSPGWLLPLFLLLLLLWLLAAMLGLLPSPLPSGCFRDDQTRQAVEAAEARRAALEDELARLREQLGLRAQLCKPAPTPPPAPVEKQPEPKQAPKPEPQMVEPFFGETPPEPEPKPELKPEPKPKPVTPRPEPKPEPKPEPRPMPRKGEDLKIPDDAAKNKDLSFLEGCWVSETGLYSHPRNEPIVAEYCFDKNGRGRRFVRERNGQICSGSAQAQFRGDGLTFEADNARCPRGGQYVPQKVECRGNNNSTQCSGNEMGGKNLRWKARFKRK